MNTRQRIAYECPDWSPRLPFCGACRRTIREDHEPACPFDEPPPDPPGGEGRSDGD
jgi:hypothetical protein